MRPQNLEEAEESVGCYHEQAEDVPGGRKEVERHVEWLSGCREELRGDGSARE